MESRLHDLSQEYLEECIEAQTAKATTREHTHTTELTQPGRASTQQSCQLPALTKSLAPAPFAVPEPLKFPAFPVLRLLGLNMGPGLSIQLVVPELPSPQIKIEFRSSS